KHIETQLLQSPDKQISLTDPDARSMSVGGRGSGTVGYNVQTAVDDQHHLIIAHEVTNVGHDRGQLSNMAKQARDQIGAESLTVVADRGYYTGTEIVACEQAGISTFVPKPLTSSSKAEGRFGKQDFLYVSASDEYRCPAGELLTKRYSTWEDRMLMHVYWYSGCQSCAMQKQCTTGKERRLKRWEHEAVVDAMQVQLEQDPGKMKVRRQTVEHPFGTLKYWMGATHFLTRTLPRVSTEMSLHVLAYNLKRMMSILGTKGLLEAIKR
ncbi:transposase, partial [Pseudomonas sp. V1]|uniref:transposase n=1 Tax=Pseudomonas arcuscaelestis TaxID=2710591 RepID=UPI00193F89DF